MQLLFLNFIIIEKSIHYYFTLAAQPRTNMKYICYFLIFTTGDYGNSEYSESFNSVI
jgi:hypothetical protein